MYKLLFTAAFIHYSELYYCSKAVVSNQRNQISKHISKKFIILHNKLQYIEIKADEK